MTSPTLQSGHHVSEGCSGAIEMNFLLIALTEKHPMNPVNRKSSTLVVEVTLKSQKENCVCF